MTQMLHFYCYKRMLGNFTWSKADLPSILKGRNPRVEGNLVNAEAGKKNNVFMSSAPGTGMFGFLFFKANEPSLCLFQRQSCLKNTILDGHIV